MRIKKSDFENIGEIYTADRETGTYIDKCDSIEEAINLIKEYEEADRKQGIYEKDFYDIVNEYHESIV